MATSIGSIVVDFIANIAKFRTDVVAAQNISASAAKGIQASFNSIGGSITGVISTMSRLGGAFAAVAGAAGLGLMIKNAVKAGDEIAEMAQRLGISSDALQELGHAANLSGASIEDLENGLRFLNKNLGEAQSGSKELREAFEKIGVDPTKFRDAGEAIGAVADGINALGNQAQKTEATLAIFGRGGNQLAILLGEGSKGIAKLREEAQRLGIVLDSATLKEAQRLADDFDRLAAVIKGNLTRSLIELGPALLKVTGLLADFAQYASYLTNVYKDIGATNETASLEELANRIVDLKDKIAEFKKERDELKSGGYGAFSDPKVLAALESQLHAMQELLRTRQALEANPQRGVQMTVTGALAPTKEEINKLEEFRKRLLLLAIPDEVARKMVEVRLEVEKLKDAAPKQFAAQYDLIGKAMGEIISQRAAAEALEKVTAEAEKLDEEMRKMGDASWVAAIEAQIAEEEELAAALRKVDEASDAANKSLEAQGAADLIASIEAEIQAYEDELTSINRLNEEKFRANQVNVKLVESLQQQIEMFYMSEKAAAVYADQLKLGADATDEMRARTADLSAQLFDLKKQQDEQKQFYADLKSIVVNTSLTASDALVDWAMTGEISFKKMADAIIKDILRIITKMLILKAIEMSINAFGGWWCDGAAAGNTIPVSGAASGGIVKARPGGRLMIVGEGGRDEAIIPLSQLGSTGGAHVSVEIINQTGTPVSQQTEQTTGADGQQMLRVFLRKEVSGAISDGAFDQQMGVAFGIKRRGVAR